MNAIKVIISILVVAILGLGAGLVIRKIIQHEEGATREKSDGGSMGKTGGDFAWGITVLPFPFPTYREAFMATQMAEAKKLGVKYVRIDYIPRNIKASDVVVNAAYDQGLKIVLIVPFGPNDIFTDKNLKKNTTQYVSDIVKRYKGKVAVYQLATEVSSVALGNNSAIHGIDKKDYPTDKLQAVTTWVMAASEAVKNNDPSAKRLVNDQWVHVGFFDNYFALGGDFDILGWNWFSDMGNTIDTVVLDKGKGQNYDLLAKLRGYEKPIWLTEVSRRLGSQGGKEKEQADFINTMARYVAKQPSIKGFFVYDLVEDQSAKPPERGYSIVEAAEIGNEQRITSYKPAYDTYKKVIQNQR